MAEKMATRAAYGKALVEIGAENPNLVVMDADLSKSTMTNEFSKTYPERFFNMGIAEQNLYGTAAGLALSGKVVCASTSPCSPPAEPLRSSEIPSATPAPM